MTDDPLLTTLLDLDHGLNDSQRLIIGGGYGLYLKQTYLMENPQIRTLFGLSDLPSARTTEDIDLILRADIVTHSESMSKIREVLDQLEFQVVETAKYTQFVRKMPPGQVKVDLLSAPLGELASRVPKDTRRVKPRPRAGLHASKLEEAIAVDRQAIPIPIRGVLSSGQTHETVVLIPQAFSYLLMKLCAYRDRMEDENKNLGQHHALDVYRIVGLLTETEDQDARRLSREFFHHPIVIEARKTAAAQFVGPDGIGRLRIREHPLFSQSMNLERFGRELAELLGVESAGRIPGYGEKL